MMDEPENPTKKLLEGVFNLLFHVMKQAQPGILGVNDKECPECGTLLSEVQSSGQLGCTACLNTFGQELSYFFTHTEEKAVEGPPITPPKEPLSHEKAQLEKELQEAVTQENYEKAAALRDKLKSIE